MSVSTNISVYGYMATKENEGRSDVLRLETSYFYNSYHFYTFTKSQGTLCLSLSGSTFNNASISYFYFEYFPGNDGLVNIVKYNKSVLYTQKEIHYSSFLHPYPLSHHFYTNELKYSQILS